MNSKKLPYIILLLAAVLRLWQLGVVPPSPDWDEAALGYNAYSILQTGRDEYGEFLPVMLESFGDYKPALYTYLIIPLLPLFGLDIIAVRLPSVLAGVLAVLLTYLLVGELVNKQKTIINKKKVNNELKIENWKLTIPAIAALLLAISPWHIQFSRVAFEANVAVTLNAAMVYFFLRGLTIPRLLPLSAVFAVLSIYTYQSEKLFVPMLALGLILLFRKEVFKLPRKDIIVTAIVGLVLVSPMAFSLVTNQHALERAKATNILANQTQLLEDSIERLEIARENNDLVGQIVNNRRVVYIQEIAANYLSHFNPNWLFLTGDAPRHHATHMGLLYLWEIPFLLAGIYSLIFYGKKYFTSKSTRLLFLWFLLAPVPAALTNDVPHAVRTLNFLPTFQIFTAVGIVAIFSYSFSVLRFSLLRVMFYGLCLLFIMFNFVYYLDQYFVQQNKEFSQDWQYGYQEAVTLAESKKDEYQSFVVSNQVPLDQSYIFFLYYTKYPPEQYQKVQGENKSFSTYEFRPIEWGKDKEKEQTLFIGSPKDFPEDIDPLESINYLNGEAAFLFVDPQN